MKRQSALLIVLAVIATMPGCGIGYNSLLFVTKSNVGLDFDAKPPTAEIAISRVEGVVEPVFENGKTLPVMASFRTSGSGLFAGEIGQTFTTGDAALVMALLYGDKDYEFSPLTDEGKKQIEKVFDSSFETMLKSSEKESFVGQGVRPVFFGTSTSFGAKLSWSGMTAALPDSLHVGYRRKELAWAPIAYSEKKGQEKVKVSVPSLLATIDVVGQAASPQKSQLQWLQYFATGKAATALALRQDVRQAMIRRLDPSVLFESIPEAFLYVQQALLPLTQRMNSLDTDDDAQLIQRFNDLAVESGYDDFEHFASTTTDLQEVQTFRQTLETEGVTFD